MKRDQFDETEFRVWPDGTVQSVEEGEPYPWLGDDYCTVWAWDEDDAFTRTLGRKH